MKWTLRLKTSFMMGLGVCSLPAIAGIQTSIAESILLPLTSGYATGLTLCLNDPAPRSYPDGGFEEEAATTQAGKMIGYLEGWMPPIPAANIKKAGYTHVLIAFGVFSTTTPGRIVSAASAIDRAYIQSLQAEGISVLLSIGGASSSLPNTTVNFNDVVASAPSPEIFKTNFMASLNDFVQDYGFDGFDFDIEQGFIPEGTFTTPTGDIAILADIINTYHTQNPARLLTLAPQIANISATSGFNATFGNYSSLVMQTHASLAWVGIQLYNSGCAYGIDLICYDPNTSTTTPDPAVAFATDLLTNWPAQTPTGQATGFQPYKAYLSPSQVVLGYPVKNASGISDGSPAAVIPVIKRAIQCLNTKKLGPTECDTYTAPVEMPFGIGGVFSWTINDDATTGYAFATGLSPCVVKGICT